MNTAFSLRTYSRQGGAALASLLANARTDMGRLQTYAERFVTGGGSALCPRQVQALCEVLEQASVNLQGRIVFLDTSGRLGLKKRPWARRSSGHFPGVRSLVGAYRSCCQRLCHALQEAKRLGDATTTWLLSDLVLRLEKQLWLLDPSSGSCRVASLFFNA